MYIQQHDIHMYTGYVHRITQGNKWDCQGSCSMKGKEEHAYRHGYWDTGPGRGLVGDALHSVSTLNASRPEAALLPALPTHISHMGKTFMSS